MMRSQDIHAAIDWRPVLVNLGIPETCLKNRHGPCPGCGGKDCFRFDHAKRGKGSFYCNKFGSGDGFKLLEHVYGWNFSEAKKRVMEAAGLRESDGTRVAAPAREPHREPPAQVPERILRMRRERCGLGDNEEVVDYLGSRALWPVPGPPILFAHASVPYFCDGQPQGRYPAIVADIDDIDGDLVSCHVTYIKDGKKLETADCRKILSPLTGREGCAVRLFPQAPTLGIAEGIETALSAAALHQLPVWAALNTSLLSKFEPPAGVEKLVIFADYDPPGLMAAIKLMERLQGRIRVEVIAPQNANDWNDVLKATKGKTT